MDERVYWIWIQHGFGEGSPMPGGSTKLARRVRGFYEDGPAWNSMPSIREKEAAACYSFPWRRPRRSWSMPNG